MTLTKASLKLLRLLALSLCVAPCGWSQAEPAKKPPQNAKPATTPVTKPAVKPTAKPALKPVAKPATAQATKPAANVGAAPKPVAKPATTQAAKPAAKRAAKPASAQTQKPAAKHKPAAAPSAGALKPKVVPATEKTLVANKRDPFIPLINQQRGGGPGNLPPGKAGLVIGTVRVDGTVRSQGQMIAVVTNPDQRVYFIRQGDRLYDGDVEKIDMEGVTFRVSSKDAFGRPVERVVTKRIYARAGELQ